MRLARITLREANAYVSAHHRHHGQARGHKFSLACYDDGGNLHGVAIVGRPVARMLDDGRTLEVTRLCTDGYRNACSFLYGASARYAREAGYSRVVTYILESENGASLKASGWKMDCVTKGGSWSRPSRPREDKAPTCRKVRYSRALKEGR